MKNRSKTLAVQDDWSWWNKNDELKHAGKLFLVDTSDTSVHFIFFDDSVDLKDYDNESKCILDIRDKGKIF